MRWLIALMFGGSVFAGPLLVTASGTFGFVTTSSFSAPDESWSLSFIVDSNPAGDPGFVGGGSVFDPPISDFTYTLGGSPVNLTVGRIVFETGSNEIFAVCFFDINCTNQLSFG